MKLRPFATLTMTSALFANVAAIGILFLTVDPLLAEGHGGTSESGSGQGGGGSDGGRDASDHDGNHVDDGHDGDGEGNDGAGGGGEGRGPHAGAEGDGQGSGGGAAGAGGQVWSREGLPHVELGRLNVARSPDQVLDRAYLEALSSFNEDVASFYRLDLVSMEKELASNWDSIRIIDSPLQNLALLRDALDGTSVLREVGITTDNDTLMAVFLGTASDKTIPVTPDAALAVSVILGQPLSPSEAAALAEMAERIRKAILIGHG